MELSDSVRPLCIPPVVLLGAWPLDLQGNPRFCTLCIFVTQLLRLLITIVLRSFWCLMRRQA
jgi:hypothetical protein